MTVDTGAPLDSSGILHFEKHSCLCPSGTWCTRGINMLNKYPLLLEIFYSLICYLLYLAKPSNDIQPICLIAGEGSNFCKTKPTNTSGFLFYVHKNLHCIYSIPLIYSLFFLIFMTVIVKLTRTPTCMMLRISS